MTVDLTENELCIMKNYIKDMLELFNEKDMLLENEYILLNNGEIKIYKNDLLELNKKF